VDSSLDTYTRLVFALGIVSWLAMCVCLANFADLLHKQPAGFDRAATANPLSYLLRSYADARTRFWRNGLIVCGGAFAILIGLMCVAVWSGGSRL